MLPDKSPGPDEIHLMSLKHCAAEIVRLLADIYQRSFNDGVIPKEWKLANISPIFKKGKKAMQVTTGQSPSHHCHAN